MTMSSGLITLHLTATSTVSGTITTTTTSVITPLVKRFTATVVIGKHSLWCDHHSLQQFQGRLWHEFAREQSYRSRQQWLLQCVREWHSHCGRTYDIDHSQSGYHQFAYDRLHGCPGDTLVYCYLDINFNHI
jgi:hypothetical protein